VARAITGEPIVNKAEYRDIDRAVHMQIQAHNLILPIHNIHMTALTSQSGNIHVIGMLRRHL